MTRAPQILLALCLLAAAVPAGAQETPDVKPEAAPETKLSKLQGTVRESRTREIVGATLIVQREDDPSRFYLTSSGKNGAFFVDRLRDGDYTVRLHREGYASEVKRGIRLKYPFRAVVEVTMEPGRIDTGPVGGAAAVGGDTIDVRGNVRGPRGEGLGEVWVRIVRQDGAVDPVTLRTPRDGTFEFAALPRGEWRLEVVGIGYLPLRQNLMLNGDSELSVQLVEQPPDYVPAPLELMPPEAPIAPDGFGR